MSTLHPLHLAHPKHKAMTGVVFAPLDPRREVLGKLVPRAQQFPFVGGVVVPNAWAVKFLAEAFRDVCPGCLDGDPCDQVGSSLASLRSLGWKLDSAMQAANAVQQVGAALGLPELGTVSRVLRVGATFVRGAIAGVDIRRAKIPMQGFAQWIRTNLTDGIPSPHARRDMDARVAANVLDLPWPCTAEQVEVAHRVKIRSAHTDAGGSDAQAARVNGARDTLRRWFTEAAR